MSKSNLPQAAANYTVIMEQIKWRTILVSRLMQAPYQHQLDKKNLLPHATLELAYQQLRASCELIALGALTAHEEIPKRSKLIKEWRAKVIVEEMFKLHPDFYPKPVKMQAVSRGAKANPITFGFLTKDDLRNLYNEASDFLHQGSVSDWIARKQKNATSRDILSWNTKIITLLNEHIIHPIDPANIVLIQMMAPEQTVKFTLLEDVTGQVPTP